MSWAPRSSSASLLSAVLLLIACRSGGPVQPHKTLTGSAEPLQSAFNADSGLVRAIVLASPT